MIILRINFINHQKMMIYQYFYMLKMRLNEISLSFFLLVLVYLFWILIVVYFTHIVKLLIKIKKNKKLFICVFGCCLTEWDFFVLFICSVLLFLSLWTISVVVIIKFYNKTYQWHVNLSWKNQQLQNSEFL
jgi:hypothetical protein